MDEFKEGFVYKEQGDNYWTADIDSGDHYGKIQCYGKTKEEAIALRDRILCGLEPLV